MNGIVYHWYLGKARVYDGVDGPVIYEYACGTFGSPFQRFSTGRASKSPVTFEVVRVTDP